jgi:hypothetical protein
MAVAQERITEHDVVALRSAVGKWPAGTEGTIVSERGAFKLIEVADDLGQMLDLISVAEPELDLVWSSARRSLVQQSGS